MTMPASDAAEMVELADDSAFLTPVNVAAGARSVALVDLPGAPAAASVGRLAGLSVAGGIGPPACVTMVAMRLAAMPFVLITQRPGSRIEMGSTPKYSSGQQK